MKKTVLIVTCLVSVIATTLLFGTTAFSAPGDEGEPREISQCSDLQTINDFTDDYFIVTQDFACEGEFTPITTFSGELDGNDKTISNITINGASVLGLFKDMTGVVKDLTLENMSVTGSASTVGGVAGRVYGELNNVHVTGTVSSLTITGGLAGHLWGGVIIDSSADVVVTSTTTRAGGLVGTTLGASPTITNSYATGDVTATQSGGGLTGEIGSGGIVSNSYATGDVTCTDTFCGGFSGLTTVANISNSFATGNVTSTSSIVGGFTGWNANNTISSSYARGNVTGTTNVGSFGGAFANMVSAVELYGTGVVTATDNSPAVGGLFPSRVGANICTRCYWDVDSTGIGVAEDVDPSGAVGKTTSAMKQNEFGGTIYADWDDEVWALDTEINDNYPYLQTNFLAPVTTTTTTTTPTTTSTPIELDSDNDGIPDSVENAGNNNGDGNYDGIADSQQKNVATLNDPHTSQPLSVYIEDETCTFESLSLEAPAQEMENDYDFATSQIEFTAICPDPGMTISVVIVLDERTGLSQARPAKLTNEIENTWSEIDFTASSNIEPGVRFFQYNVIDGGELDDDGVANGTIEDPVAIIAAQGTLPATGTDSREIAMWAFAFILAGAALIASRKVQKLNTSLLAG